MGQQQATVLDELMTMVQAAQQKMKGDKDAFKDVKVMSGDKPQIILPPGMDATQAIEWIKRKEREENQEVRVREIIDAYPLEGAHAMTKALEELHGFVALEPTWGFFGPNPPVRVGVEVSPGVTVPVAWGNMQVPGIHGRLSTGFTFQENRWHFVLEGVVLRKSEPAVQDLVAKIKDVLAKSSIYKGHVIRVDFKDDEDDFDIYAGPRFVDVSGVKEDELIFSEGINQEIDTNLFVAVEQTEQCLEFGIPLKRGVGLDGTYGVGKTLTAAVLSKKCENNGWTFIYLKDPSQLPQALAFARNYEPAVIFAEDIDQVTRDEDEDEDVRGVELNEILNAMDGIDTKTSKTMVVFTTNHLKYITRAALRPGRIDAIITIDPPDAAAVAKLIQLYGRGYLDENVDLDSIGASLQGCIPALVREAVERARRKALRRIRGMKGAALKVTTADLESCVGEILRHRDLLNAPEDDDEDLSLQKFGQELGKHIALGIKGVADGQHSNGAVTKALEASV